MIVSSVQCSFNLSQFHIITQSIELNKHQSLFTNISLSNCSIAVVVILFRYITRKITYFLKILVELGFKLEINLRQIPQQCILCEIVCLAYTGRNLLSFPKDLYFVNFSLLSRYQICFMTNC